MWSRARGVGSALVAIVTLLLPAAGGATDAALAPVSRLVAELREQLGIPDTVDVEVVADNHLLVSVTPVAGAFRMSFEARFLARLSADELRAVVAHELGHVWIYGHHPYLQTERLANRIAMRVVSRESLVQVYGKVWAQDGTKGDLASFLEQ